MVNFKIELRAQTENIQEIIVPETYEFHFKIRCCSCQEIAEKWIPINISDSFDISGSRGKANLVMRCKFCKRESTASFVGPYRSYAEEQLGQFTALAELDCRGLEPVEYEPRGDFTVVATSGSRFERVDLSEDWVEYDEKSGESLSITEIETRIERA